MARARKGFFLPPSTSREKGHAMIGVLLAFLVVFRPERLGHVHGGAQRGRPCVADEPLLALELLASLAHACVEEGISEKTTRAGSVGSGGPASWSGAAALHYPRSARTKRVTLSSRSSR